MASKKKRRRCDDVQEGKTLCNERNQQERLLASGIVDNFPISNRAFALFFSRGEVKGSKEAIKFNNN